MTTYSYELRSVTPQGKLGAPLPDAKNVGYFDDDSDTGSLSFDYPLKGRNASALDMRQEIAVLVDGERLPQQFVLQDFDGNTVSDGEDVLPSRAWVGVSLFDRLDEALVLPVHDLHLREDVFTEEEREEYLEKREEWMQQAIKDAIQEAKDQAREHNDKVRERRKGGKPGQADPSTDEDLNKWGRKAIKWALSQIDNPSQNWYRMCQSFVRQSFGLPGIYGTASEAWFAGMKRPNTPFNRIPAGVPVYWGPNHVALSVGDGDCISTDVLRAGYPDLVPISSLSNGVIWSLDYRGWSPECSGRRIYP